MTNQGDGKLWALDTRSWQWEEVPVTKGKAAPSPRCDHVLEHWNGDLYLLGGSLGGHRCVETNELWVCRGVGPWLQGGARKPTTPHWEKLLPSKVCSDLARDRADAAGRQRAR